jgi:hypothetical protein
MRDLGYLLAELRKVFQQRVVKLPTEFVTRPGGATRQSSRDRPRKASLCLHYHSSSFDTPATVEISTHVATPN